MNTNETNSRCHQQLRPHNTEHKHTNQSNKHHTTTYIFTRYNHGVPHTIQSDIVGNSSGYLPIITTIHIRHDYRLQQNRQTFTNYQKADWTQFTERHRVRFRSHHDTHQYTHCQHNFHKHHTDERQSQHTKGTKMHSNCRLLPKYIA